MALVLIGKSFNCISATIMYMSTQEIFNTSIRATALNACSGLSRIGPVIGAYAVLLVSVTVMADMKVTIDVKRLNTEL